MTVRVGFLGGGFIAGYHAKMLRAGNCTTATVYDPDPDKARAFADANGASVACCEEEVLSASDAVYVCTWTAEHRRLVEAVASRGLPVFVEKPLAFCEADAVAMVEAVNQAGVINQVGLVLRDSPSFIYLRHCLGQGDPGRVMSVVFRDDQYIPIQGMYGSTWRADATKAGAGTVLEHSIHDLDLIEWLFGPVLSVSAQTAGFHGISGIEDVAAGTLRLAGGGIATLVSVWHDLLERPSLRRMEILCERAFFVLEGDMFGPVRWSLPGEEGSVEGKALMDALGEAQIQVRNPDASFIAAVESGDPADPDLAVALRAHQLADAIYRSAAEDGALVPTPPLTGE